MRVIIIGGGPSGLMAAKIASKHGHNVLVLDSQDKVGKKLLMTGNSRCNITNNKPVSEFLKKCSKSSRFMYSSLTEFGPKEIIEFFENNHCPLIEEDENRMFPKSQKSRDILDVLMTDKVQLNTKVESFNINEDRIISINTNQGVIQGDYFVLSTGGKSFPITGSDGSGYKLLKQCGHTITNLVGIETGLHCENTQSLQGISLKNVTIKIIVNNKVKAEEKGDVLFTHFGLSGPGILKVSETVVDHLDKQPQIQLDLEQIDLTSGSLSKKLKELYPQRFVSELLKDYTEKPLEQTSNQDKEMIKTQFLKPKFIITNTQPIEKAFVTKGGVKTNEIDPKTMKSKLISNLSICGEVLDAHGQVGGYNLTLALSSGYTAGHKI